jgi:hypothetical protein
VAGVSGPIIAFKVHGDISAEQFKMRLSEIKAKIYSGVVVNDVMIRYRILLVSGEPPKDIEILAGRVLQHKDERIKLIRLPVETKDSRIKIPTGELVVQFKSNVGADEAIHILQPFDLRILQYPQTNTPGRYRAADEDDDVSRLLRSARTLAMNDSVRYVEPDTLELAGRPTEPF